jgi:hypothetical protein
MGQRDHEAIRGLTPEELSDIFGITVELANHCLTTAAPWITLRSAIQRINYLQSLVGTVVGYRQIMKIANPRLSRDNAIVDWACDECGLTGRCSLQSLRQREKSDKVCIGCGPSSKRSIVLGQVYGTRKLVEVLSGKPPYDVSLLCECGARSKTSFYSLLHSKCKACGGLGHKLFDNPLGRFKILSMMEDPKGGHSVQWECRFGCGKTGLSRLAHLRIRSSKEKCQRCATRRYTINGKSLTIVEISKLYGLEKTTVARLSREHGNLTEAILKESKGRSLKRRGLH